MIYFDQDYDQEGIQNIDGAMFWVTMNQFFSTYTSMLTIFTSEIPVFMREHDNGLYRSDTYFISKQVRRRGRVRK